MKICLKNLISNFIMDTRRIHIFGVFLLLCNIEVYSITTKQYDSKTYSVGNSFPIQKHSSTYTEINQPKVELILPSKPFTDIHIYHDENFKHRSDKIRKKKKIGRFSRQKNKAPKLIDYVDKQIIRHNEKVNLVHNRTIEILKNGMKILSAEDNHGPNESRSNAKLNATLFEKILSSAVSKPKIFHSTIGSYKIPIDVEYYDTKTSKEGNNGRYNFQKDKVLLPFTDDHTTHSSDYVQITKENSSLVEEAKDYDSDYDFAGELKIDSISSNPNKTNNQFKSENYETFRINQNMEAILEKIVDTLKIHSTCPNENCSEVEYTSNFDRNSIFKDPCQRWLNCKGTLESAFLKERNYLPSCPCFYPSIIFYDDSIWDKQQKKYFRWRDASGESERLDIYKPGAAYCIRSLVTQGSSSISSQQCCYDRKLQLLTRGSGAGTVNYVSPDVSKNLHDTIDMLPWRLCKGDFTRYHMARNPDNGNNCQINPDDRQYQKEIKLSKIY